MKFSEYIKQNDDKNPQDSESLQEASMKYQALAMAKEIHSRLAELSFVEMLGVMSPDNPAKKEVQALESKINDLTREIGDFVIKYMPDVAAAEPDDLDELPDEEDDQQDQKDQPGKQDQKQPKK